MYVDMYICIYVKEQLTFLNILKHFNYGINVKKERVSGFENMFNMTIPTKSIC